MKYMGETQFLFVRLKNGPNYSDMEKMILKIKKKLEDQKKNKKRKISDLIEDRGHISFRDLGRKTNLHKNTVKRIVIDELGLRKTKLMSIPHELTEDMKKKRVEISEELLKILINVPEKEKRNVLTMDESWIFFYNPASSKFISADEERPKKVKKSIGSKKILLSVIWDKIRSKITNDTKDKKGT